MKKKKLRRGLSLLLAVLIAGVCLLSGCGAQKNEAQENAETIQVYLWNTTLYENYAPYIQSQLPDVNIEFIVGNNDLDFYKFLNENGGLPDIITSCRFSLHDAAPLKDSLMNLALTNEAGAVYNTYLDSFKNEDGSVNWLPVCADAHGFVVNRGLFEEYGIPLPTDYASFVSACKAFEKHGIRGFDADYFYDYTCMETLQGLSVSELSSAEGRRWRTAYSDPASTEKVGLDDAVWPAAFENLENFIRDTGLNAADLTLTYDDIMDRMRGVYDSDVLIAAANSFTGSVLAADYTEKMAASMIMPNDLFAYRRTMTGAELTETVRAFVEGCEGGFTPFNRGSLPTVSGIAVEVREEDGGFELTGVKRNGKTLQGDETVTVTCLATAKQMTPLLADESRPFEGGETRVRDTWRAYAAGGNAALAEPEHYIRLR